MMSKSILMFALALTGSCAFAQDIPVLPPPVDLPPDWLMQVMAWAKALPYVGPILVELLKWLGFTAAIMTALTIVATTILRLPEIIARYSGAPALADKIEYWSNKIIYWLKYFSIFNAKK